MTAVPQSPPGPGLTTPSGVDRRQAIEFSWKRSWLNGIQPAGPQPAEVTVEQVDPSNHLMRAAGPVLDMLTSKLSGTRYSLLLADRDGRIQCRWFDDPRLETVLDSLGIRPGASASEDVLGTSAIGIVLETRRGIAVHGEEHFIEPFQAFSCYAHPIIHPVSKRLVGVLDISGTTRDANPLLAPFLVRAVEDIEFRLLDQARASERLLLAAFQAESRYRDRAVVALGDDVVLTNRAAGDLLAPADFAALRLLANDLDSAEEQRTRLTLASGTDIEVCLAPVQGARAATLFRFARPHGPVRRRTASSRPEPVDRPLLIEGATGTGRSTEARRIAPDAVFLHCGEGSLRDEAEWTARLRDQLSGSGALCVEHIELLSDAAACALVDAIANGRSMVLTSSPVDELTGPRAALAAMVVDRISLPPLRDRCREIGTLAMSIIREVDPAADVRLIPRVVEALASHSWPGNFHELRAVLTHVLRNRTAGDVTLRDLPEEYRTVRRVRLLAGRERAEREAIVEALRAHDGNKARAAGELGISRTTLYARMRALKIMP
ncbi:GAF domain-containing protein [Skermania sp. ID1734]|uniref:sigma-54-dependent Fis family transcriptional regulator n=1 Tax=Skermania sp. ID1734 TaxID=2597516 RepID=UPI00117EF37E|nr:helix-turn-helix domain-containing protein [Skermania sp. ID1734]TSE01588.1 GAF domain-containing protein [Skermania sp. ID1734]